MFDSYSLNGNQFSDRDAYPSHLETTVSFDAIESPNVSKNLASAHPKGFLGTCTKLVLRSPLKLNHFAKRVSWT